ncbi:MAG: thioredoxin family protein [Candidatus Marinimicrobia bacterium]|jgi:thioredoxin 1|nr:thioredoxin family protein [Candidatus Neomarinimicrobiota bacterium]MBT3631197.1 thioredoxin family protein [Candidatus Neomarinimicrobiota bacterium]MBT3824705.1 thioredoxin family protein [Candidatus Neomarinimicrobiota bacterium]MBT4131629.1 thioredoxin family protein [Candidatus Neomarinimicrobiota bacterium]MBT4296098.1 thioredoxin family protein [Candidatus Neomarinimicrobiota bacterium]
MLNTNLKHITSEADFKQVIESNEKVMVCCGRMGPMCLPVYDIMEDLEEKYESVVFYDMAFDSPDAHVIRNHPKSAGFMGLPFTYYFKNGEAVEATSSIQSKKQVKELLDKHFA